MKRTFIIALTHEGTTGKAVKLFVRFVRNRVVHVGRRESATGFSTRTAATAALMAATMRGLVGTYRVEVNRKK